MFVGRMVFIGYSDSPPLCPPWPVQSLGDFLDLYSIIPDKLIVPLNDWEHVPQIKTEYWDRTGGEGKMARCMPN